MDIRFTNEKGAFSADNCKIVYKNFSGAPTPFNKAGGVKEFALVIEDPDVVAQLRGYGYNVREKDSEEGVWYRLPIKIKFNDYGPDCFIKNGRKMTRLDEQTIGMLDSIALESISIDVRPHAYEINGGGTSAYLSGMCVSQRITSRFAQMAAECETITDDNDCPFE